MITDEQIINAIAELSKKGYPPTVREVMRLVGLKSSSAMHQRLKKLQKLGTLAWEPNQSRTMRLVRRV